MLREQLEAGDPSPETGASTRDRASRKRGTRAAPKGRQTVDFPRLKKTRARAGRPTKYHPEYCERVIACGRRGKSRTEMACEFRVARKTLSEWAKVHPDFDWAYKFAMTCSQAWWERIGYEGCRQGSKFNAAAYIFQMKARFPEDYGERRNRSPNGSLKQSNLDAAIQKPLPRPSYED